MPRPTLEHRLTAAWQRRGPLAMLLWPLSLLYGALTALRCGLYAVGALKTERLPVPVIVIGNVVAGGAGKTPTTIAVVQYLQSIGMRPGIVSRGHGRRGSDCLEVQPDADARDTGDEPLLLRLRCQVPVFVAPRRADAASVLLAAHPERTVLVCDDGLQHLALARDIDICVFDARGVGNGWLLPAGPLREPWPRAVDLVLITESVAAGLPAIAAPSIAGEPSATEPNRPDTFTATRCLADHAVRADGTRMPLSALRDQPITALAGIARPEAFFAMLRAAGLTLARTVALPDHHDFDDSDALFDANTPLICTEKDAVKLWPRHPSALAVPLVLTPDPAFFAALNGLLALAINDCAHRAPNPPPL